MFIPCSASHSIIFFYFAKFSSSFTFPLCNLMSCQLPFFTSSKVHPYWKPPLCYTLKNKNFHKILYWGINTISQKGTINQSIFIYCLTRRLCTWFKYSGEGYLNKLHITEDVHRIVRRIDVVAATVKLGAAAPIIIAFSDGGLRTVQATATGWWLIHYKQRGNNEHNCYTSQQRHNGYNQK